jgi:hypothetical protein
MRSAHDGAIALADELRAQGGTAARTLACPGADAPVNGSAGPAQIAASGPRAAGREREYELLIEMILEGSLLHYGGARVIDDRDRELALLLGDQLYALGLARLAQLGDLEAVAQLADLISLISQVRSGDDATLIEADALIDALWAATARAVGWGAGEGHDAAKALVRAADPRAQEALRQVAQTPTS